MSTRFLLFFSLFLFLFPYCSYAQKNNESGTDGRYFIVGFMENEIISGYSDQVIFISAVEGANIKIVGRQKDTLYKATLAPGAVKNYGINAMYEHRYPEDVSKLSIEIISDKKISVVCYNVLTDQSSEGYTAIPVKNWGKDYYIITMPNDHYELKETDDTAWEIESALANRPGEFLIMASENNTTVSITPAWDSSIWLKEGETTDIMLQKGEVYFVQSKESSKGFGDLSGTRITADKPIGVLSGNSRVSVPITNQRYYDSKDHICEMLPSTDKWGKEFFSRHFGDPVGDYYKIVAKEDDTHLAIHSKWGVEDRYFDDAGDVLSISSLTDSPVYWQADKPVLLMHFSAKQVGQPSPFYENYDPSAVVLAPLEQFVNYARFRVLPNQAGPRSEPDQYIYHGINVVCDAKARDNMKYDGMVLSEIGQWKEHDYSALGRMFYSMQISSKPGPHTLSCDSGSFSGMYFGRGLFDSYAMMLGYRLQDPALKDDFPPEMTYEEECASLTITATDTTGGHDANTGIDDFMMKEASYNFKLDKSIPGDGLREVKVKATVIDKLKPALLVLQVTDIYGNITELEYKYEGFDFNGTTGIAFDRLRAQFQKCENGNYIENPGTAMWLLEVISMPKDPRISVTFDKNVPISLLVNERLSYDVCINPMQDSSDIKDSIVFRVRQCDVYISVPITGTYVSPGIIAMDYDFGSIRVGETATVSLPHAPGFVVTGTIDLNIAHFNYATGTAFVMDTLGYFPKSLKAFDPGSMLYDTAYIEKLKFIPPTRGDHMMKVEAVVDTYADMRPVATIRGKGVNPEFGNIFIDLGKVRVGVQKDTVFHFHNTGDDKGALRRRNISKEAGFEGTGTCLTEQFDMMIEAGDSSACFIVFEQEPGDEGPQVEYYLESESDWKLHQPVTVKVVAQGTLPEIAAYEIDMGTIYAGEETLLEDALFAITGGNEQLTVTDIYPESGDTASFKISDISLNTFTRQPGEDIRYDVRFSSDRTGYHEMYFAILNDAMPAYETRTDLVKIFGNVVRASAAASLETDEVYACDTSHFRLVILNDGDIPVTIDSLTYAPAPFEVIAPGVSVFPVQLDKNESRQFDIAVLAQRGQAGPLDLRAYLSGFGGKFDSVMHFTSYVEPISTRMTQVYTDSLFTTFGQVVDISVSGGFDRSVSVRDTLSVGLQFDREAFFLMDKITYLYLYENGNLTDSVLVNVTNDDLAVKVEFTEEGFMAHPGLTWRVDLRLTVALNEDRQPEIQVLSSMEKCFDSAENIIYTQIEDVCIFPLRHVKIIINLTKVSVTPNPTSGKMEVTYVLPEDALTDFWVTNNLGLKIDLVKGQSSRKGTNKAAFDVSNLGSGTYMLNIHAGNNLYQEIFIITK